MTRATSERERFGHNETDRLDGKLCSVIGANCSQADALANKLGGRSEPVDGGSSISETGCPTV